LQPGDSGQARDSGGKYPETLAMGKNSGFAKDSVQVSALSRPETLVPNPEDSGVDELFHPDFNCCLCFPLLDMCAYLPCYHILFFTGGSRHPRTKASVHHEGHVPRHVKWEKGPRKHVLEYNEEKDRFVQRSMAANRLVMLRPWRPRRKRLQRRRGQRRPSLTG
jgi:hypothetical protein